MLHKITKVARGTFKPASEITKANKTIVSIEGLGFKPEYVLIAKHNTANTLYCSVQNTVWCNKCVYDNGNITVGYMYRNTTGDAYSYYKTTSSSESNYYTITVDDDGFTFSTGSLTNYKYKVSPLDSTFDYVAIGGVGNE